MPITDKQLEQRKKHIGSSDMAAIMGLSPFKNANDVFLEKTQDLDNVEASDAMKRGNYLEGALLDYAEDNLGPIDRDPEHLEFIKDEFHFMDHPDGLLLSNEEPLEGKSVGAYSNEHWGDAGTDDMPHRVIIQSHFHMICTDQDYCHVPVYLPYREFQMFGVERDKEICEIIIEAGTNFWDNHVLKGIPPDGQPNIGILKRIKREPESVVDIDSELVRTWLLHKAAAKEAKVNAESIQAEVVAALGTAEAGRCEEGLFTYLQQSRTGIDSKLLKADHPDIAEAYAKISTFRVARLKKG